MPGPRWVCPAHGMCALLVYTAQAPGCSAGELSKTGPEFCALPRSKLLRLGSGCSTKADSAGHEFCALPGSWQFRLPGAW